MTAKKRVEMEQVEPPMVEVDADLIADIDEGWRYFWARRGFSPPPPVTDY